MLIIVIIILRIMPIKRRLLVVKTQGDLGAKRGRGMEGKKASNWRHTGFSSLLFFSLPCPVSGHSRNWATGRRGLCEGGTDEGGQATCALLLFLSHGLTHTHTHTIIWRALNSQLK